MSNRPKEAAGTCFCAPSVRRRVRVLTTRRTREPRSAARPPRAYLRRGVLAHDRVLSLDLPATPACRETLAYCLSKGGKHAAEPDSRLLMDCAEPCDISANKMGRGADVHARHRGL